MKPAIKDYFWTPERASAEASASTRRWTQLVARFLPVRRENSIWCFSRESRADEPSQGWKLHISATVPEACEVFETTAAFLVARDVQFKAPATLGELSKINRGLEYGYHQVGKFITVYPSSGQAAAALAGELDELTKEFTGISVPFDERFAPGSSIFYRYGAFAAMEITDERGVKLPALKDATGKLVPDDRYRAVPAWVSDPFPKKANHNSFKADSPLVTTYHIFRALAQRGKGGTYQAIDLSQDAPRLGVVKEGRRFGELEWNGQDGFYLVSNEYEVLRDLNRKIDDAPRACSSFEIDGNFYLAMEYVEGSSLHQLMKPRRRRFSSPKVLELAVEIARIIEKIHGAGWVWNDCKPANLIVTAGGRLRPIDFEGAFPIDETDPFDWTTTGFSKKSGHSSTSNDLYALGAVIYFLLTGVLPAAEEIIEIGKLRRGVNKKLAAIVKDLLAGNFEHIADARKELETAGETGNVIKA